jgi:type I restriction enzyme, S subunit
MLPKLPGSWRYSPLKRIADLRFSSVDKHTLPDEEPVRLCNYLDVYKNEHITASMDFMVASATPSERERFALQIGDVMLTKDSEEPLDIAIPACVVEELSGVLCGYHLALARPHRGVMEGRFLQRALQATGIRDQFYSKAVGVTRFAIGLDDVGNSLVPLPPPDVQRRIASFLDGKTAAIDVLIKKKERFVELLHEERQTLITQAVTKGLDLRVPVQESAIPSIGSFPRHWRLLRLKHLSPRISGRLVYQPAQYFSIEGVPFLMGNNITERGIVWDAVKRIPEEVNRRFAQHCLKAGDVVTVRVGAPGVTCVVPREAHGLNCGSLMIIRRSDAFDSTWLAYVMNSPVVRTQIALVQYGAAQEQINITDAVNFVLPTPPLEEQVAIARWLDRQTSAADRISDTVSSQIETLREYRGTLISAAVSGQIDLSKEAA